MSKLEEYKNRIVEIQNQMQDIKKQIQILDAKGRKLEAEGNKVLGKIEVLEEMDSEAKLLECQKESPV